MRINRTELVFTANEAPPDVSIFLHHEMAQTPLFPSTLFFFCEHAPDENGRDARSAVPTFCFNSSRIAIPGLSTPARVSEFAIRT